MSSSRLHGCLALVLTLVVALATAGGATAERTVYFADPSADVVAQFDVGPGGALSALQPRTAPAPNARRLALTPATVHAGASPAGIAVAPGGLTAYVLVAGGVKVFDVDPGGRLVPRAGGQPVPSA